MYGHIPATPGKEHVTAIGFCSHMDTVSDYCDHDANPQIIENYDGGVVKLGDSGLVLDPEVFPHLKDLKGRTLSLIHILQLSSLAILTLSSLRLHYHRELTSL